MRVHAGIARVVLVFARRMGGHGDDRQVAQPWVGPDDAAGGQPVRATGIWMSMRTRRKSSRCSRSTASLAVGGDTHGEAGLRQKGNGDCPVDRDVLDQQHPLADQRGKAVACGGGLLSGLAFGTAAWLVGGSVNRALKRRCCPRRRRS